MGAIPAELLQQIANPQGGSNVLEMFMRGNQQAMQNEEMGWKRMNRNALLEGGNLAAAGNYPGAAAAFARGGEHQLAQGYISMADKQKRDAQFEGKLFPEMAQGPPAPNAPPMVPPVSPNAGNSQKTAKLRMAQEAFRMGDEESARKFYYEAMEGGDGGGGMFSGNSVEAQALNHLVATGQIDQTTAANIAAGKPITDPASGQIMFVTPQQIMQAAQAAGLGQAQVGAEDPGQIGTPLTGRKPPSSEEIKGEAIYRLAESSFPVAVDNFDALSEKWSGSVEQMLPSNYAQFIQSDSYKKARTALKNIAQAEIFATSGQQAPPAEVQARVDAMLPHPADGPDVRAAKKATLEDAIRTIQARRGRGTGQDLSAPPARNAPVQGAQRAPDGNWYVPDPSRPGKYLRVDQ